MISISNIKVGDMFRERRKNLGISIVNLANECGLAPSHISMMESGKTLIKDGSTITKLCKTLCDDGSLFSYWSMASLKLGFFNEDALELALFHFKSVAKLGPLNMEESHD